VQEVDSQALERVAASLRTSGAPAPSTEFQSGLLQQTLDVERLLPGTGIRDGWFWTRIATLEFDSGTLEAFETFAVSNPALGTDVYDTLGANRIADMVWLMGLAPLWNNGSDEDADLNTLFISARYPTVNPWAGLAGVYEELVFAGGAPGSDLPLTASGLIPVSRGIGAGGTPLVITLQRPLPFQLGPGTQLRIAGRATNVAALVEPTANVDALFWCGPKALRPPGVA
jgi:hypothetical protein